MDCLKRCFSECKSIGILEKVRNVQLKEWQKYIFPAVVIAVVWGLMLLPIISYHLPNKQVDLQTIDKTRVIKYARHQTFLFLVNKQFPRANYKR